jgi:fatty acid desaturase
MTSTSPQTGLSTYSANAPKTLRKVKDKAYGGITLQSFGMAVVWVFVSMVFILPLAFFESWVAECFVIALVICWWLLYVKFVSTENKLEESFLFLKFLVVSLSC